MLDNFYTKSTYTFNVTVTDADKTAIDISGDAVTIMMKEKLTDSDASAVLSVAADVTTDGANGVAQFTLDTTDTNITAGFYFYEIKYVPASGGDYVLEQGTVKAKDRVFD